ncbi:MAG: hypothetical protein V4689_02115 [Verrucomicrobiota bacterium]
MNQLTFQFDEFEGVQWVHLFVDGRPIEEVVGDEDAGLCSSYFEDDDLPHFPPRSETWDGESYMLSHCDCGEYGCGNASCRIRICGDSVIMDRFQPQNKANETLILKFDRFEFEESKRALLRTLHGKKSAQKPR